MNHTALFTLAIINVPMCIGVGNLFFKDLSEFRRSLVLLYQRRNVFFYDWNDLAESGGEMKAFFYILCCICVIFGQYCLLMPHS